jgi:hypothetical protein
MHYKNEIFSAPINPDNFSGSIPFFELKYGAFGAVLKLSR